jgi:hypothetical protein
MTHALPICLLFGSLAAAQEPPILIRMIREPLRDVAAGRARTYAGAGLAMPVFGASAATGAPESVFFEFHDSYAGIEGIDQVANTGMLSDRAFSTILLHIPGLSYRPDLAARLLPRARYFQISTYRIRPGSGAEFGDLMRLRRAAYDAINLDRPEMAYQVVSGASSGTYVMIAPLTSLKTLDNGSIRNPAYATAVGDMGANSRKIASEIELNREHQLLRLEPELSYVSEEFAGLGPNFWRPKFK